MILKPPTNFSGSKDKLIPQLLNYFPKDVNKFYDVFAGGLSVTINTPYKNIISNDIITPLIEFYKSLYKSSVEGDVESEIQKILEYKIDKKSKEDFLRVREEFNSTGNYYQFFALVSSCTNNMMRFNKKFKFNQTFGERTINENTLQKIRQYSIRMKEKDIHFYNENFINLFEKSNPCNNDFVYLDPPYFGLSEAGYNAYWSADLECKLYDLMSDMTNNGIRFALSGMSIHKDVQNPNLKKLEKYNIINLDMNYDKVAKNKSGISQEILVTNYNI